MALNDLFYSRLIDSESEINELSEEIEEGLELHREKAFSRSDYDPNTEGRKDLEELYEKRLKLQYRGALTFHPYSEFGRLCLSKAQELIDEYENEIGLLHTRITRQNVDRFKGALTLDLMDDIRSGRYQAIGALRYDGEGVCGAGALVYEVDTDRLDDEYLLRIKWLFVKEPFRRRGVATTLLGSILWKNRVLENENVIVEVPINPKWTNIYSNMLYDGHFDIEAGYAPQIYLRTSEVEILDDHFELAEQATPLRKLSDDQRKKAYDLFSRNDVRLTKLLNRDISEDYFDGELSCIMVKKNKLMGILLVHVLPSGIVRMEYLGGDIASAPVLCSYMILSAKETKDENTMIEILMEDPELADYFDAYYENHLRTPIVVAALQKPGVLEDVSPEDAAWILAAP